MGPYTEWEPYRAVRGSTGRGGGMNMLPEPSEPSSTSGTTDTWYRTRTKGVMPYMTIGHAKMSKKHRRGWGAYDSLEVFPSSLHILSLYHFTTDLLSCISELECMEPLQSGQKDVQGRRELHGYQSHVNPPEHLGLKIHNIGPRTKGSMTILTTGMPKGQNKLEGW